MWCPDRVAPLIAITILAALREPFVSDCRCRNRASF
jgi:hypothetical protein